MGVPDGHRCDAPIVLIGEAGGKQEQQTLRPFVGQSGVLLGKILKDVGLRRDRDIYVTNVVPYQPTDNNIHKVSPAEMVHWVAQLHTRLAERTFPCVIVPTGNTALHALLGLYEISKWRGSILWSDQHGCKVIPTLHPAGALREPGLVETCVLDWTRIRDESKSKDHTPIPRDTEVRPSRNLQKAFLDALLADPTIPVALDIETDTRGIICVGFAASPYFAISLLMGESKDFIKQVCELPNPKVLQNGLYDLFWLHFYDIYVKNYKYDCGDMFHALNPNAGPHSASKDKDDPGAVKSRIKPYSLAYMTSIFTREPYYKDEAKEDGKFVKVEGDGSKRDRLMRYNGKDCMVTLEIHLRLKELLEEQGKMGLYEHHYSNMYEPLLAMMTHGVAWDVTRVEEARARNEARCKTLKNEIVAIAGVPLHTVKSYKRQPKDWEGSPEGEFLPSEQATKLYGTPWVRNVGKSISTSRLNSYLYKTLKLPARITKGKATVNEAALRGLIISHPEAASILSKVLEFRKAEKLNSFLAEGKCDADGRVRCQYKLLVQTGRLSSTKNPRGTGMNLQNIDRSLRDLFIPDEGCAFLEVDLSQAEDRIVKCLSGHPDAIKLAKAHPADFDVHSHNAARIFSRVLGKHLSDSEVTEKQRYLGKRVVHATNYGMTAIKLQEVLLKDGIVMSFEECQSMLDAAIEVQPWIRPWQHDVKLQIIRNRTLVTPFGRIIDFSNERLDDELYRRAYAYVPQSTCGDVLNQQGLIPLQRYLTAMKMRSKINLQVHDSLLISVVPGEAWDIASFLNTNLSNSIIINPMEGGKTVELSIPATFRVGLNWGKKESKEWKRLPTKSEMTEFAAGCRRK